MITVKEIEKFDNDKNVFYRFQNPDFEVGEESWGMIYNTREEAIEAYMEENDCSYEEAEEYAILPGKSCMPTFEGILNFASSFDDDFVLLIFKGEDTRYTGHDDEYVARYDETITTLSMDEVVDLLNEMDL